ncbi:MAG: hypothetical protein HY826_08235 [Actinobacteria bacterium]|nr:hypothetical protein [Actinomycetota bacterium]
MSTALRDQIRQLAVAFDEWVDDVTIDDVRRRNTPTLAFDSSVRPSETVHVLKTTPSSRRLGIAAAWVLLVAGLVAALAWIDRDGPAPIATTPPTATIVTVVPFGQFVWPAPPRPYTTVSELVTAFTTEVLGWDAFDVVGDMSEESQPQVFMLVNSSDASVSVVAIPSKGGWGFVQIGQGMSASADQSGGVVLSFPTRSSAVSSSVVVRLSDGSGVETTVTSDHVELPGVRLEDLVSALAIVHDSTGRALTAVGGTFTTDSAPTETAPSSVSPSTSTITAGQPQGDPVGPLDYATTEGALPYWPDIDASDPPATTSGYGMQLCDSGYGTKVLRVDPAAGAAHAYSGTLCVFIDLAQPRVDAVTSCATSTDGFNYARCQRRTDQTDVTGAGTARRAIADPEEQTAMQAFPSATAWDQAEIFDANVGAATLQNGPNNYSDGSVVVTLDAAADEVGVDQPGVCYVIELPGATARGCVGRSLLRTGLAYGAFQDGDGPIELVGIVPDEVTAIEVDGQIVTPTNNVWHYTATSGAPLTITVRSEDGRAAKTT